MAKLQEELIAIRLSKLIRDNEEATELVSETSVSEIEAVLQEMLGESNVIVEVVRG